MNHGLLDGISIIVKMADDKKEEEAMHSGKRNETNSKIDNYNNKINYKRRERT